MIPMVEALRNAIKVPELRKRILFTLGIIAIYRFGCYMPTPGVDVAKLQAQAQGGIFGLMDLFTGGAFYNFAIFSFGIMPYIMSSIIIQMLTAVIPKLKEIAKEGEAGQRKLIRWTRYLTVIMAIMQSIGTIMWLNANKFLVTFSFQSVFLIVVTLVAGTALIMWLGELITERGIGNGISLIIFISIISRLPVAIWQTYGAKKTEGLFFLIGFLVFGLIIVASVIFVLESIRKIPVQYAKRVVGRRMYGVSSSYIPLRVNQAGVMPIIFASSVLYMPVVFASYFPHNAIMKSLSEALNRTSWQYVLIYSVLIFFFTYFYTAITFNPIEYAEDMRKYGGFIPGIRPGMATASYLEHVLSKITFPGALFLVIIAIIPTVLMDVFGVARGFGGMFGGTSLLIMVGVALETMKQLEVQLMMRHYEGFLKKRGRAA